jgi:hypothetical protein
MKHYTFDKHFDDVFTTARLLYELSQIKPIPDDIEQIKTDIKYNNKAGDCFLNCLSIS